MPIRRIIGIILFISLSYYLGAQNIPNPDPFTILKLNPCTPVKNQYKTNTCWCFSVLAMFESELLQKTGDTLNLSEMYIVRKVYEQKAIKFVRMHGTISLTGGGALNDAPDIWPVSGIVPEPVYHADKTGGDLQDHTQLDQSVKEWLTARIGGNPDDRISDHWLAAFDSLLDQALGPVPEHFIWKGREWTPSSFADSLGIHPFDYWLMTSFSHHPWYTRFAVEVPDNWNWGQAWNIPMQELKEVITSSLLNGYTVAWAGDISEPGFDWKNGVAKLQQDAVDTAEKQIYELKNIHNGHTALGEPIVTQALRQQWFDDYATTDDHAMLLIGLAKDTAGRTYYIAKNSWGTQHTRYGGFLFIAEPYLLGKTLTFLVNRNSIPLEIKKKILEHY